MADVILRDGIPLYLATETDDLLFCSWHNELDCVGEHQQALLIGESEQLGICLPAVEPCVNALEGCDEQTVRHRLEQTDYILCTGTPDGTEEEKQCIVCGEETQSDVVIQFSEPILYDVAPEHSDICCLHISCRQQFAAALNKVWEYTDDLLSENL